MKKVRYRRLLKLLLAFALLVVVGVAMVSCATDTEEAPTPTPESTPQAQTTPVSTSESRTLSQITPVSTPTSTSQATTTPAVDLASTIENVASAAVTGIQNLSWDEVLRLLIWLIAIVLAVIFGGRLVHNLLRRLARRTETAFDDALIEVIEPQIRWFIAAVGFNLATLQIEFLSDFGQSVLAFISFLLYLFVVLATLWRSIDFSGQWYIESKGPDIDTNVREQLVPWAVHMAHGLLIIVAIGVLLAYFGINLLAIIAALGIGGFAIGLAAKDTITNVISGIVIMIDKPFQVGERIHVPAVETWGDVVAIGMRSSQILTRDNRLIIVPNAVLVEHDVINYSRPDPSYRLEVDLGIAYNGDIPWITKVLEKTVRSVDGVMADKPVDILFTGFGDAGMDFRVRWWVAVPGDKRRVTHRVCSAIRDISDEKGIELPDTTYAVVNTIKISPETAAAFSGAPIPDKPKLDTSKKE